ncbi:hypothetical protein ACQKFO_21260 [Rossellomorea sp. NPDC071047]|uniref:hypothetical protein n=1 Tax=Rossellomorea sp. NPDC071047 TaxID=3390675 RepID=UPI003CFF73C3
MSMQEFILEKFSEDPLLKMIDRMGFREDLLHTDYFENIHLEGSYSTKEACSILGLPEGKDWMFRNYLKRHDLNEYLDVGKVGNQHRFDYSNLFKFNMIFLLVDKGKKTPMDIALEVGMKHESYMEREPISNKRTINPNAAPSVYTEAGNGYESLLNDMENLKTMFLLNQYKEKKAEYLQVIKDAKRIKEDWTKDMEDTVEKIEILELSRELNEGLNNTPSFLQKEIKKVQLKRKKFLFFGPTIEDEYVDETAASEIQVSAPENLEKIYDNLKDRRDKLEREKETLFAASDIQISKHQKLLAELDEKTQPLLSRLDTEDTFVRSSLFIEGDGDKEE